MFDGIYIESEMIFLIRLALSTERDRLMYDFHLHVQYFHFHLHGCMFFRMEAPFIFFASDDPFGCTDKIEKCKESFHTKLSNKMKDEKL